MELETEIKRLKEEIKSAPTVMSKAILEVKLEGIALAKKHYEGECARCAFVKGSRSEEIRKLTKEIAELNSKLAHSHRDIEKLIDVVGRLIE